MDKGQIGDSGEYPCSVCKKGVGSNSGMCLKNITVGSIKDAAAFQVSFSREMLYWVIYYLV